MANGTGGKRGKPSRWGSPYMNYIQPYCQNSQPSNDWMYWQQYYSHDNGYFPSYANYNYIDFSSHDGFSYWDNNHAPSLARGDNSPASRSSSHLNKYSTVKPPQKQTTEKVTEAEAAPLGSEAAWQKERDEIAQRLKALDKQKEEDAHIEISIQYQQPPQSGSRETGAANRNKSAERPVKAKHKSPQKVLVKSATKPGLKRTLPVVNVPTTKRLYIKSYKQSSHESSEEMKRNIHARLSAMGKEELKHMIDNPKSAKSQEIMKALMHCYQDTKALELDKRRFANSSASTSTISTLQETNSSTEFSSIAMTDLPHELVAQLENFLGCDVFGAFPCQEVVNLEMDIPDEPRELVNELHQSQEIVNKAQSSVSNDLQTNKDAISNINLPDNSETEIIPLPSSLNNHIIGPCNLPNNDETPFKILKELAAIDKFIQESMQRKMQLYEELHKYIQVNCKKVFPDQAPAHTSGLQQGSLPDAPLTLETASQPAKTKNSQSNCQIVQSSNSPSASETTLSINNSVPTQNTCSSFSNLQKVKTGDSHDEEDISFECFKCKNIKFDTTVRPVTYTTPQKTNVNDMKVVSSKTVVIGCENGISYGYNINTGNLTHVFKFHSAPVTALCSVPSQGSGEQFTLCSGSIDENICFFDSETQLETSHMYLASRITCLEMSSINILYIGLFCGQIHKYDTQANKLLDVIDCNNTSITALLSRKEGPRHVLLVAALGKALTMRDANSGLLLRSFIPSIQQRSFSLAVHADMLYSSAGNLSVPYFNLMSGKLAGKLQVENSVSCIRIYKHILFAATYNGLIYIFDLKDKKQLCKLSGHGACLKTLEIHKSQEGKHRILTCSRTKKMVAIPFPAEVLESLRNVCSCTH